MSETSLAWGVTRLECAMDEGGEYGIVTAVMWTLTAKNDAASVATEGSTTLEPVGENCAFTPFGQLTEAQVVGWVKSALGDEAEALERRVVSELEAKITPPIIPVDPPWREAIVIPPLDPVAPEDPLISIEPSPSSGSESGVVMGTDMPTSEG